MATSIEGTGSRSPAAQKNQSFHIVGRERRGIMPYVSAEEERLLREELEGKFGIEMRLPKFKTPGLLVVDIHRADISGADALAYDPETEPRVTRLGKKYPNVARAIATGFMIWRLRRSSQ